MSSIIKIEPATLTEDQEKGQELQQKSTNGSISNDIWISRIIVGGFAAAILAAVVATATLQAMGKETPTLLTVLGTGALSGLTALRTPLSGRQVKDSS